MSTLDSLENETLRYAFRFRTPVATEFEKLPIYADTSRRAVDVLEVLATRHQYLEPISLFGRRTCYKLSARFSQNFECDFDTSRPLKERDKTKSYAMLRFCLSQQSANRQPLNALIFEQHFPKLYSTSGPKNKPRFRDYYLAPPKLGFLRVDMGGEGAGNGF